MFDPTVHLYPINNRQKKTMGCEPVWPSGKVLVWYVNRCWFKSISVFLSLLKVQLVDTVLCLC